MNPYINPSTLMYTVCGPLPAHYAPLNITAASLRTYSPLINIRTTLYYQNPLVGENHKIQVSPSSSAPLRFHNLALRTDYL